MPASVFDPSRSSWPAFSRRPRGPRTPPPPATVPGLSEVERTARLEEAGRYKQESLKLANSGKLEEAVVATRKRLAIEREVLGELHEQARQRPGIWCATG